MASYRRHGVVTQHDLRRNRYLYLAFEVPAGTTSLQVRYQYDAGNLLDIGLFDPTAEPFPTRTGFRGWSGSKRREFFVASDAATPGYLPGPLAPGRWHVVLGLARILPSGCSYQVEIELSGSRRAALEPPSTTAVSAGVPGWYRGDLQSHSHHSDASGTLEDLVRAAGARGLDFLSVTDHNTTSHHRHLAELSSPELLLIPGEEVTTYHGHANVLGADGWIDFRLPADGDPAVLAAEAKALGGLFSINHPKRLPNCIGCDWQYPVPEGADCFEAWHGPWPHRNWESLERYDALLAEGRRLTLVGGSDRHQPGWPDRDPGILQVGSPTTWLYLSELSLEAVLDALRAGRAFVSEGPDGPRLEISAGGKTMGGAIDVPGGSKLKVKAKVSGAVGDRLVWTCASGTVRDILITTNSFQDRWTWRPTGPFLRAQVVAETSLESAVRTVEDLERLGKLSATEATAILKRPLLRALSNPIYLQYSD